MPPKIKIISKLLERLLSIRTSCVGYLYGVQFQDTVYLIGFHVRSDTLEQTDEVNADQKRFEPEYDLSEYNYPTEIDLYGIVLFLQADEEIHADALIKRYVQDVFVTDNPIYVKHFPGQRDLKTSVLLNESYVDTPYQSISMNEFHEVFAYVRLMGSIPLTCDANPDSIAQHLISVRRKVSKGDKILYKIEAKNSKDWFIFASTNPSTTTNTVNELIQFQSGRSPKQDLLLPLNIQFLLRVTKNKVDNEPNNPALAMTNYKGSVRAFDTRLNIDALIVIARSKKGTEIYTHLAACLSRRIKHLKKCLLKDMNSIPIAYHFLPPSLDHFITLLYPSKSSDADLVKYRELVHRKMALSLDKPFFRRGNAHIFNLNCANPAHKGNILKNVHQGLAPSGVNGTLSLVYGNYEYYHYRQQGEDDEGWGCAYRSLQTLYSWFLLAGYTSKEVPSIRAIQQVLVDIQDKPSKFLGSRDWIGSTEVSFVLDTLLGVTSRILSVSGNETLLSRAPELSLHFETHGTPVMIGGGVLAHTILGIDYDKDKDVAKFLVLDPHYNGEDNLQVIQSKGWCGWKNDKFWKKGTFYNMCMPMKKICI